MSNKFITAINLDLNEEKNRKLAGFIKINSDLLSIEKMIERALQLDENFLNYQGIIITYRKCFENDARKASLGKIFIKMMNVKQKDIHDHLESLGNKLVAHPESDKYDSVALKLVLDKNGKAISIEPLQTLWDPLGKEALKITLEIVNLAMSYLGKEAKKLAVCIMDEYNNNLSKKITLISIEIKACL